MGKNLLKRVLPLLLAIAMVATSVPANTLAAELPAGQEAVTEADTQDAAPVEEIDGEEVNVGTADDKAVITIPSLNDLIVNYDRIDGEWMPLDYNPFTIENDVIIANWNGPTEDNSPFYYILGDETPEDSRSNIVERIKNKTTVAEIGEEASTDLKNRLTFKWQMKNSEGTYVDLEADKKPTAAGEYRIEVALPAADNGEVIATAEARYINFKIKPVDVRVSLKSSDTNSNQYVGPAGTKVGTKDQADSAINKLYDNIRFQVGTNTTLSTMSSLSGDYKSYIGEPEIKIYKADDTAKTALAETDVLSRNVNYKAEIKFTVIDAVEGGLNFYNIDDFAVKVGDLKILKSEAHPSAADTVGEMKLENAKAAGTNITRQYTGAAVADIAADEIELVIESNETDPVTGEKVVIRPAAPGDITYKWLDANDTEIEGTPVNAGAYKYQATFNDSTGVYDIARASVTVIVEPIKLTIKPVVNSSVNKGIKASEALRNVTYQLLNADGSVFDGGAHFFGVTYNNPSVEQVYVPVFAIQAAKITDKTANKADWDNAITIDNAGTLSYDPANYAYRVVFSGKKGYYKNGELIKESLIPVNDVDVNSANLNYNINLSNINDNAAALTVATNDAKIDVSGMLIDGKGADMNSIFRKAYDHKPIYAEKAEYKKAKVTISGNDSYDVNQAGFTYKWYSFTPVKDATTKKILVNDNGKPVDRDDVEITSAYTGNDTVVNPLSTDRWGNENGNFTIPKDAGYYFVEVTYNDPKKEAFPAPARVYYHIEPQIVKVGLDKVPDAVVGMDVTRYLALVKDQAEFKFYTVPNNDLTVTDDKLVEFTKLAEDYKKVKDENGIDDFITTNVVLEEADNIDASVAKFNTAAGFIKEGVPYRIGGTVEFADLEKKVAGNYTYVDFDGIPYFTYLLADDCTPEKCTNIYYKNYTNKTEKLNEETEAYDTIDCPKYTEVKVVKKGTVAVNIELDETKLPAVEKDYDGEGFDLTEAIANGFVKVTDSTTGEAVDLPLVYGWSNTEFGTKSPANAGKYALTVYFDGNETYMASTPVYANAKFVINKKKLTVTPILQQTIKAGTRIYKYPVNPESEAEWYNGIYKQNDGVFDIATVATVEGYIDADKELFGNGKVLDAKAFKNVFARVKDNATGNVPQFLKYGHEYSVELVTGALSDEYDYDLWGTDNGNFVIDTQREFQLKDKKANNYEIVVKDTQFKVTQHGNSTVNDDLNGVYNDGDHESDPLYALAYADYKDNAATVSAVDGIPYIYPKYDITNKNRIKDYIKPGNNGEEYLIPAGNLFTFRIYAPAEYRNSAYANEIDTNLKNVIENAVYRNSVEAAGGYVLKNVSDMSRGSNGYITVAFPYTADKNPTFTVQWEPGFEETFTVDFSGAICEDDIRKAVAPKKLAFNSPEKKMVVGETQNLDVKITKLQASDVVFLNYAPVSEADAQIVSVDKESGVVTALKPGKASVQVYPVYQKMDGTFEAIEGFKPVIAKITVTDVSIPTIKEVKTFDTRIKFKYVKPKDGYRREYYILPGTKTEADFVAAIEKMNGNGKFMDADGTIGHVWYQDAMNANGVVYGESVDAKGIVEIEAFNLVPNTDYTLYVRNVSGMRTLDDGSEVAISAKGNVKPFKTTKVQIESERGDEYGNPYNNYVRRNEQYNTDPYIYKTTEALKLNLDAEIEKGNVEKVERKSETDRIQKTYYNILLDKTNKVALKFSGKFKNYQSQGFALKYVDSNAFADWDYEWIDLPMTADNKANYCEPNLTYYVVEDFNFSTLGVNAAGAIVNPVPATKKLKIGNRYFTPSKIATIDKKGNLNLKGIGRLYIVAYDSASEKYFEYDAINVVSNVSAVKAKNITMKVGDTVDLYDYLTFSSGKKKLTGKMGAKELFPIAVECSDESFKVNLDRQLFDVNDNQTIYGDYNAVTGQGYLNGLAKYGQLTATAADKKNVELTVSIPGTEPLVSTKVKVTVKDLDKVGSLKAVDVVDKYASFTFTYKATNYDVVKDYQVELRDQRGSLVFSEIRSWDGDDTWTTDSANGYSFEEYYDSQEGDYVLRGKKLFRDNSAKAEKQFAKGVYTFRGVIDLTDYYENGVVTRLSKYTLTVTPVYGEYRAKKAAKTSFKTTNIPVGYQNLGKTGNGGSDIRVRDWGSTLGISYLASGNTYTLKLIPDNQYSELRKTDKLKWKVTNSKVAKIKSLAGTYEAQLTAVKPGMTDVEVTSGITKKVVARYKVRIKTVGNAGNDAYQNAEPENGINQFDLYYNEGVEVLTEANPVRFKTPGGAMDYRWVAFTAPVEGNYQFDIPYWYEDEYMNDHYYGWIDGYYYLNKDVPDTMNTNIKDINATYNSIDNNNFEVELAEGQKIYIKVVGDIVTNSVATITVKCTSKVEKLALNKPVVVNGSDVKSVSFTVPENDYYVFCGNKADQKVTVAGNTVNTGKLFNEKNTIGNLEEIYLTKGTTVTIRPNGATKFAEGLEISVIKKTTDAVTEAGTDLDIKPEQSAYYVLKADKVGDYTFSFTTTSDASKIEVSYRVNNDAFTAPIVGESKTEAGVTTTVYKVTKALVKDDVILIKVKNKDKADNEEAKNVTGKLSMIAPVQEVLALGESKTIEVKKGEDATLLFTFPEADTEYGFFITKEATAAYGDPYVTYYWYGDKDGDVGTHNDSSDVQPNATARYIASSEIKTNTGNAQIAHYKGTNEYIKIASDLVNDRKFTVTVKPTSVVKLANEAATDFELVNNEDTFFEFTPNETGMYSLKVAVTKNGEGKETHSVTGVDTYAKARHYKEDGSSYKNGDVTGSDNDFTWTADKNQLSLTANTKYVFMVNKSTSKDKSAAKITIAKDFKNPDLPLGKEIDVKKGQTYTYRYVTTQNNKPLTLTVESDKNITVRSTNGGYNSGTPKFTVNMNAKPYGTVYEITVTGNATEDAKVTFNVANTYEPFPAAGISGVEIKNSESKTYEFTVTDPSVYTVSFSANKENPSMTVKVGTDTDPTSSITSGSQVVLTPLGGTYYVKVTNNESEAIKANVTLTKATINEIAAEEEVAKNTSKWVKKTFTEAGRYEVKVEGVTSSVKYEEDKVTSNSPSKTLTNDSVVYATKGETYFIKLTNSTSAAETAKISFTKVTEGALTLGTASAKATVGKGTNKYYKLSGVTEGKYKVTVESKNDNVTGVYYSVNIEPDQYWMSSGYSITVGSDVTSLTFAVKNTSPSVDYEEVSIKVEKIEAIAIAEGSNTITKKSTDDIYGTFTVPSTGKYFVYLEEVPADITDIHVYVDGYDVYKTAPYKELSLTVAQKVGFDISFDVSAGKEDVAQTIKFKVAKVETQDVTSAGATYTAKQYVRNWFKFTAPEDGRYTFGVEGKKSEAILSSNYELKKKGETTTDTRYFPLSKEVALKKGDSITFYTYYNDKKLSEAEIPASDELKLTITALVPTALVDGNENDVEPSKTYWYAYTATQDGMYSFKFTKKNGGSEVPANVARYANIGVDEWDGPNDSYSNIRLAAGEKAYFKFDSSSSDSSIKAEIKKIDVKRAFVGSKVNGKCENDGTNNVAWFTFNPSSTGKLELKPEGNSSMKVYKYVDGKQTQITSSLSSYPYEKGVTYDVKLYGAPSADVTLEVKKPTNN